MSETNPAVGGGSDGRTLRTGREALETAKALLRPPVYRVYLTLEHHRYHRYLRRRLGPYVMPMELGPPAPKQLILKTAELDEKSFEQGFRAGSARAEKHFVSGIQTLRRWFAILETHGFNIRTVAAIMELGCGSGRLLRHVRCIHGVRLVGCDVDAECVDWCRAHFPGAEFYQNALEPPLSFAESDEFDLIYAYSVFTHIPIEWQKSWLREIHRILRPGGFFVCTVVGDFHVRAQLGEEERQRLKKEGHLVLSSHDSRASLSTRVGGSGWDVFQTRREVIRTFGAVFRLLDYIPAPLVALWPDVLTTAFSRPRGQDVLILQKTSCGMATQDLTDNLLDETSRP